MIFWSPKPRAKYPPIIKASVRLCEFPVVVQVMGKTRRQKEEEEEEEEGKKEEKKKMEYRS